MVFFSVPERKRYLSWVSALHNSQSNAKNVPSQQAFKHPPKAVDGQCNKLEEEGEHMFSMSSSTDGLISPARSFSALSHSSSLTAASICNHLLTSPIVLHICHIDKASHADSQQWKSLSDAACCHGHYALDMAVIRTISLSSKALLSHQSTSSTYRR